MLRLYLSFVVGIVMCQSVIGQLDDGERPSEWLPGLMPNPVRNPQHCRVGQKAGYVCDPDEILTKREVEILDWYLKGTYLNDTVCPCAQYWCDQNKKGTHISVALVNRMKLPDKVDDPSRASMEAATRFALDLQQTHWDFGSCDNDIVIFYSKEDGVLFTSFGYTTGLTLSNTMVEYLENMYARHFRDGNVFRGLTDMIWQMRLVLNHQYYDHNILQETPIGASSHVTSGILATVILAFVSLVLS